MEKKNKLGGLAFASSLAILGMVSILAFTNSSSKINAAGAFGDSDYTVVLDSSNKLGSSETHKDITTSSGNWQIGFDYTNCSVSSTGHATIANGGKIVNTVQITSIDYMQFNFSGSGSLRFRTSYDGATWSGYSNAISTEVYNLPSLPYYVELSATGGSVNLEKATYQYTCVDNPAAHGHQVEGKTVFQLVEDEKDLISGDVYTFATVNNGSGRVAKNNVVSNYYLDSAAITVASKQFDYVSGYGFVLSGSKGAYQFTKEGGDSTPLYDGGTYQSLYFSNDGQIGNKTWNIDLSANKIYSNNPSENSHYFSYGGSTTKPTTTWNSYKGGQDNVTYLYHKVKLADVEYDTPSDIVGITVSDTKANDYTTENTYSSDNGLIVKAKKQDGTQVSLTSTQYTYNVSKTQGGSGIDKTKPFPEAGTYWVRVQYSTLLPVDIQIIVGNPPVVVTAISASMTTTTYTTAQTVTFTNNLKATLSLSDGTTAKDVPYANFSEYGLSASLLNPNGVAHNMSQILGVAGNWSAKVYKTDNPSVYGSCAITVNAVPVQDVTLDKTTASIEVGKTVQLVATVTPSTATTKSVAWESNAPAVATVDSNGLVTGVSAGTAVITVTTTDGSFKATCTITVTEPVKPAGFEKITDASKIEAGMKVVIGNESKGVVAGDISNSVMGSVSATFENDVVEPTDDAVILTVGGTSGAWTLENDDGELLGATTVKKLAWDSGTTTWDISISSGSATIQNGTSGYGRFLYNVSSPRFTTYTSDASASMLLPELYGTSGKPVYATSVSLPSTQDVALGNAVELKATVSPSNYNQGITWSSTNETIATVDNGVVTGIKAGQATIKATVKTGETTTTVASCTVTVKTIAVTGVTLNESSTSIGIGSTFQLTPTISPSNASNKNVSWSSNKTTIASVDSSGLVTAKAVGTATITCTTQDGGKTATCSVTVTEQQKDKYTILIYMSGNDLESESSLASGDLDEIKSVKNQPDDVNIVIEAGGAKSWDSSYSSLINSKKLNRFHLSSRNYVLDEQLSNASMGKTETFQSFLEWGLTEYPAEKTGVILWNHGGGMRGVCYDENYSDDSLYDYEVVNAVKGAFQSTGTTKLEWIGYDACLMGLQDVAEFNSPYFNYMVGSEESEAGYGWDYDTWIDDVYANKSTETILKAIVDGFITDNGGVNGTGSYWEGEYYPCDQTLAYYNLNYMSAYKTAFEELAGQLKNKITSSNKSTFNSNLIGKTKYFGGTDYDYFCTFDVWHFLTLLEKNSTFNPGGSYISNVKTAFGNLVAYSSSQQEAAHDAHGLAFYYVAGTGYSQSNYSSSTYSNFTDWSYLSKTYGGAINSTYQY